MIEGCSRHARGIGAVPMPGGARLEVRIERRNEKQAIECLGMIVRDAERAASDARLLPCAELLLLGASIVEPGTAVGTPSAGTHRRAEKVIADVARGQIEDAAKLANVLLAAMGSTDKKDRKRAEADYTILIKAGLRRGVLIPLVQRAYNTRRKTQSS